MQIEIERKFLVKPRLWKPTVPGILYIQGYVAMTTKFVVRVRIKGDQACLTMKAAKAGLTRKEYEYPIPISDAEKLLADINPPEPIRKIRYRIPYKAHLWEVDEFQGANQGLLLAEIELKAEDESFETPPWIGKEVTGDERFYNAYIYHHPFNPAWLEQ
jgi:CYTH domain-containing protein